MSTYDFQVLDFLDFHVKGTASKDDVGDNTFDDDEDYSFEEGSGDIFGVKDSDYFDFLNSTTPRGRIRGYRM